MTARLPISADSIAVAMMRVPVPPVLDAPAVLVPVDTPTPTSRQTAIEESFRSTKKTRATGSTAGGGVKKRSPKPRPNAHGGGAGSASTRYWSKDECERFHVAVKKYGAENFEAIAADVGTRTAVQVRSHAQKYYMKLCRRYKCTKK